MPNLRNTKEKLSWLIAVAEDVLSLAVVAILVAALCAGSIIAVVGVAPPGVATL